MAESSTESTSATVSVKKYITLSFSPVKSTASDLTQWDFQEHVQKVIKVTEEQPENTPEKPFEIPTGKYLVSMRVADDIPTADGRYLHEMWHMESDPDGHKVAYEGNEIADVRLVCKFPDALGSYDPTCEVVATSGHFVMLGEVKLSLGLWEFMLVGHVERCFKQKAEIRKWRDSFLFKKRSSNLKYHILAV